MHIGTDTMSMTRCFKTKAVRMCILKEISRKFTSGKQPEFWTCLFSLAMLGKSIASRKKPLIPMKIILFEG